MTGFIHAQTSAEKAKLRSQQFSKPAAIIPTPATIATGTLAAAPDSNNKVTVISWTKTSGNYADILPDLTCLIGSTAGAYDKGSVRVRNTPAGGSLDIGETSEIGWQVGDHLTFIDDFFLWPRHIVTPDDTTIYMDSDIAYTDQHSNPDPHPMMGSDVVVEIGTPGVELTRNGGFDLDVSEWTAANGALISWVTDRLAIDANSAGDVDQVYQDIPTYPGAWYDISVAVWAFSDSYKLLADGVVFASSGIGAKTATVMATGSTMRLSFRAYGAAHAVLVLSSASVQAAGEVSVTFDGGNTWAPAGTIATHAWTVSGGATITGDTTATPTITVDAPGIYRVSDTVTTSGGKSFTGHRYIYAWDDDSPPTDTIKVDTIEGDYSSGLWTARLHVYDADRLSIRDRGKVILFDRSYFAGLPDSVGQQPGRENIIIAGWISGETIQWNPDYSEATFEVRGPAFWFGQMVAFPAGLEDSNWTGAQGAGLSPWLLMTGLTLDGFLWHMWRWRSTASRMMDCYPLFSLYQAAQIAAPGETLWEQMQSMCQTTMMASPVCDPYGRLFVQIDQNLTPLADRATFPVVMELLDEDLFDKTVERRQVPGAAYADVSGVFYVSGSSAPMGAIAPGDTPRWLGAQRIIITNLIMGDQDQAIEQAGLVLGAEAGPIIGGEFGLSSGARLVTLAPYQWVTADVDGTTVRFIPRSLSLEFDAEGGYFLTNLSTDGEGIQFGAIPKTFPGEGQPPVQPPVSPPAPPPPPPPIKPPVPPPVSTGAAFAATSADVRTTADFDGGSPTWTSEVPGQTGILDADVDPNNNDKAMFITVAGIWKTENLTAAGAATWAQSYDVTAFPLGSDLKLIRIKAAPISGLWYALGSATIGAGAAAVVGRSGNNGLTWTWSRVADIDIAELPVALGSGSGWAGTETYYTVEGGVTSPLVGWVHLDATRTDPLGQWPAISGGTISLTGGEATVQAKIRVTPMYDGAGVSDEWCPILTYPGYEAYLTGSSLGGDVWEFTSGTPRDIQAFGFYRNHGTPGELYHHYNLGYSFEIIEWNNVAAGQPPQAIDVAPASPQYVYVGTADMIFQSTDGGSTWTSWYLDAGANDVCCDPQLAGAIYAWLTDGNLVCIAGGVSQGSILTESPEKTATRIARNPSGAELWTITGGVLKKKLSGSWSTLASGYAGGRGLRAYGGGKLTWVTAGEVYYSGDSGATQTGKKGSWSPSGLVSAKLAKAAP